MLFLPACELQLEWRVCAWFSGEYQPLNQPVPSRKLSQPRTSQCDCKTSCRALTVNSLVPGQTDWFVICNFRGNGSVLFTQCTLVTFPSWDRIFKYFHFKELQREDPALGSDLSSAQHLQRPNIHYRCAQLQKEEPYKNEKPFLKDLKGTTLRIKFLQAGWKLLRDARPVI